MRDNFREYDDEFEDDEDAINPGWFVAAIGCVALLWWFLIRMAASYVG